MSSPTPAPAPTIAILCYPGAQVAAVRGLVDLFVTASHLHAERGAAGRIETIELEVGEAGPPRTRPLTAIVLPPSLGHGVPDAPSPRLTRWLVARHGEGTTLCSVCVGAFVLAETGLLAGRPATTHWALREVFAGRFPAVALDTDRILVDDGDIVTAGGVMAWVDLGLRLIERHLGPSTMLATARYFLVDPGGREQRFYSSFAPPLTHGDAAVLRVQHWLQSRCADKLTLPQMAAKAGLGGRTFLRRFSAATGLRPTEYVQHLRVGKARELLELTKLTIDEITWKVGYEDPGAFRKLFLRLIGLTPGEYRRRFAVAAQR